MTEHDRREHNVDLVRRLIEAQAIRDADALLVTMTDDIVLAYPLNPPGHPERIDGKAQVAQCMARIGDDLPELTISGLEIHGGADP